MLAAADLFERVHGQERVVEHLRRATAAPVHAYLFVGPPGTGKRSAAVAFAAALLCPNGGDGTCRICRQVLAGAHVDLRVEERTGPYIRLEQAQDIARAAILTPTEAARKVLVLTDFHLVEKAAPALLKTIEEAPRTAVFIILADNVPPELVTIASRCVRVDFPPLTEAAVAAALEAEGIDDASARAAAAASAGRLDRARLLARDPDVGARRAAWEAVPTKLDGTGATAAILAADLLARVEAAFAEGLVERQAAEVAALEQRASLAGEKVTAGERKELETRHRREQRRLRTDELRWGLATLAGAYRDRAVHAPNARSQSAALRAADAVHAAGEALIRNPNESLLLQALLVKIEPLRG